MTYSLRSMIAPSPSLNAPNSYCVSRTRLDPVLDDRSLCRPQDPYLPVCRYGFVVVPAYCYRHQANYLERRCHEQ